MLKHASNTTCKQQFEDELQSFLLLPCAKASIKKLYSNLQNRVSKQRNNKNQL